MDYKQKYEEALERAKRYQGMIVLPAESMIETIFPELAESEGEKIKKEITNIIMQSTCNTEKEFYRRKELCDWLEKQEQNPTCKVKIGEKYKCIASPRYTCFFVGDIYEVTDDFIAKLINLCSDCFVLLEKQGEQKSQRMVSAEAKENGYGESEDEKVINEIINTVTGYHPTHSSKEIQKMVNWIEQQKSKYLWTTKKNTTNL